MRDDEDDPDMEDEWDDEEESEWAADDRLDTPTEIIAKDDCVLNLDGNLDGMMPLDLTLRVTVGYDDNYVDAYYGDHDEIVQTIKNIMTESQVYWLDESLGARINVEVNIFHIKYIYK